MNATDQLRDEVRAIVDKLSHDELRVFRFNGRRVIDIGHAKYGPLDLSNDRRDWKRERAEETADGVFFYDSLVQIAEADREQERLERRLAERHDAAYAQVATAIKASFVIDEWGTHEVLMPMEMEGVA